MGWPVVQGRRIKVRTVRPHDGANFRVNSHLIEKFQITQWAVKLSAQNRLEVDDLLGLICKPQLERVRANDGCGPYKMDWVRVRAIISMP